ncbi:PAS domain S-box protein [Steroidobacter sp. S1-65]|uniref:PAS domain S-box protein n=1 Tax=Steroidobacter gossypii TaxID=2805490 RepID=A0ABS1WSK0_9GAMM|nr:HD domain-containing phosphohydrolase [Steroidobacter gossypii]MBM0103957.1 PAS domain S-box protein [Steroidobacter gossypii]
MGVILIAFERESEQIALETLLSGRGHRVLKSANGLAALDVARREPPQAIVSDIVLPRMDGFALCRKWKQDERLQSIPFVFYTRRHDDPKYERFALELGAERFLARSTPPEKLLSALDELLPPGHMNGARPTVNANGGLGNGHGNGASGNTRPMNMLDTAAMQRFAVLEKSQADALEKAQAAQRQQAAQAEALEKAQKLQAAQAEALERMQRAQAAQAEALEKAQREQAEAIQRAERAQLEAEQKVQHAQAQAEAQAEAVERAMQAHSRLRSQVSELEAVNRRLADGEARFRRVFESNPLPMWIADHATGGFIAVNDAALAMYGYSRAEFLALKASAFEVTDAGVDPQVKQHRRKDGGILALSIATRQIEFDGRNADLVSAFDLTQRLELERQLQEQANSGAAILDAVADGSWLLGGDGQILDVNAAYCRMSGYSKEELLRMNAADIEDQSSGETTMRLQLGRVRGGGRYETKHRRRDGSLFDVEVSVGLLENARDSIVLIRETGQRRRELIAQRMLQRQSDFLVDLFKQADTFDESAIVRRVIEQAMEITRSPLGYLYFVDPVQKTITLAAWRDGSRPQVVMADSEPQPLGRAALFTDCVRSKHVMSSNDMTRKPQNDGLPDLTRYLAVPMLSGDEVVAVLGVGNRETSYNEDDQRTVAGLADGVWRVLHTKRAHAVTLSALQRTDVALQGMIDSFVRMSERHDPYTAGSSRRLAALAVAIGREAGLDGERQHGLRVAALLHDIGNIAVPASILSKPAPLTETELALMRTHVEEGCQLLAEIDFGAPVAEIVFQSHERFDGSGYPVGLKGEEIMIEARILAIADTVEAMCSPRPYRPAAGMDAAIDEINRAAGRLYDEHLVAACTRLIRQHGFTLPE